MRDAACVATGRFTLAYPAEVRPYLDRLWDRWFAFLADINWSVRDDAATTLAAVIKAYGSEVTPPPPHGPCNAKASRARG